MSARSTMLIFGFYLERTRLKKDAIECASKSGGYRLIGTHSVLESLAAIARIERKLVNPGRAIEALQTIAAIKAEVSESDGGCEDGDLYSRVNRMANPAVFEKQLIGWMDNALVFAKL